MRFSVAETVHVNYPDDIILRGAEDQCFLVIGQTIKQTNKTMSVYPARGTDSSVMKLSGYFQNLPWQGRFSYGRTFGSVRYVGNKAFLMRGQTLNAKKLSIIIRVHPAASCYSSKSDKNAYSLK
jgi:hypothetical protein